MDIKNAYDAWADQYDTNKNRTRDLEAASLKRTLANIHFDSCLEIGCGTGKNTQWLLTRAKQIMAVDLSEKMLSKAKQKINAPNVQFVQANILQNWNFTDIAYDLITCSLVLEHIQDLDGVFNKISGALRSKGHVYVGELHPFKQYGGTKARYETVDGMVEVSCFNHNISDFTSAAVKSGLQIVEIVEYFDDDDRNNVPRILAMLFKKH